MDRRFLFLALASLILASWASPLPAPAASPPPLPASNVTDSRSASGAASAPALPARLHTDFADIIFHNGVILTMEADQPQVRALAIQGNEIMALGGEEDVMRLQGPETQVVNLAGRTMMPGFVDGHSHLLAFPARRGRDIAEAQQAAIEYGITTVSEMWANQDFLDTLLQAEAVGQLRMRVNVFPIYNEGALDDNRENPIYETWYRDHDPILDLDRHLRIPGIKVFVDGDFTPARGCWALSQPYLPGWESLGCGTELGDLYVTQSQLDAVVQEAQDRGYRVAFHSMGDGAIETVLNAIERALDGRSNDEFRHAIQHTSLLRPDQLERMRDMGVIASIRGYHDLCDGTLGLTEWGAERQPWYVNRYRIPFEDMHSYIEADFGWTVDPADRFTSARTLDPLVQIYGMATHQYVHDGVVCDAAANWDLQPTPIERALQMYTIEPAYATSMEDAIGSLLPGKFADLIVLSDNPLTVPADQLKDLQVWMTMIDGKVEYCRETHPEVCPKPRGPQVEGLAPPLPAVIRD